MIIPYELPDPASHDNVLIFPGGGYNHVSLQKEGADVAAAFNNNGFNAYVLEYRVEPFTGKDFLQDAVDAMRTVRQTIGKNGDPGRKLALMGFSAGGHLALTETEHWQEVIGDPAQVSRETCRADALILCYPVVTFTDPYAHSGSRANFLGPEHADDEALINKYSAEKHVDSGFPPTFLWHCEGDASVPVENSLMLRDALERAGVEHKLLLFPGGAHGLGLAKSEATISTWFGECVKWLRNTFSEMDQKFTHNGV